MRSRPSPWFLTPILVLPLLSAALSARAAPGFHVRESPAEVRVETPAYAVSITREGFAWTVFRGGKPVLKSAPGTGPLANGAIIFPDGPPQPAAALKSVDRAPDRLVLEYGSARKKTALRVEVRPLPDRVRITTVALHRDPPLHAVGSTLRFEMAPSGRWYGGGFQGWRGKQALPLNEARIETPGFIAFGKTQASPFWYSTSGAGVWVRTPRDFAYAVNRVQDGKSDGLISVGMRATTLTYDLLVAADIREIVRAFLREVGYPSKTPPD